MSYWVQEPVQNLIDIVYGWIIHTVHQKVYYFQKRGKILISYNEVIVFTKKYYNKLL